MAGLVEGRSDEIEEDKATEMEFGQGGAVEMRKDLKEQLGRKSGKR